MKTFKRTLASVLCFACMLALFSAIIIEPSLAFEPAYYKDAASRNELSGSLDLLVSGASHGLAAFDTRVLDEELGCSSYNLSGPMMTLSGRKWLLEKELKRNPVDTVVIEVSYNTLSRAEAEEYAEGDTFTLMRMDSFAERFLYTVRNMPVDDWLNAYSRMLTKGINYWKTTLTGSPEGQTEYTVKGFRPLSPADLTISEDRVAPSHNGEWIETSYLRENIEQLRATMDLCGKYDVRVIVVVTPLPDACLWQRDNWDGFYSWLSDFCRERNCEFYDFNLLKTRYELFHDKDSFHDYLHLSSQGADIFTAAFAEIVKMSGSGKDVADLFYGSYDEMKNDSPYMQFLG